MLALLRYRRIPYQLLASRIAERDDLPQPKVQLLPTFFLPNAAGELEAVVDSTPLIRRFEAEIAGRSVVPRDPVLAFVDALIEDYADEWLTKAMFHYRWHYPADIEKSGDILPRWRDISAPEELMQQLGETFKKRQISRLWVVGSNTTTAPVIEASYRRFLDLFKALLEKQPFFLGQRPGSSDFAAYGQLSQLAKFDPTPMELTLERAPRVFAWCDLVDDLSGLDARDSGWLAREELSSTLGDLLSEIGRVYAPFLLANAAALQRGAEQVETTIDGQPWVQKPFPYQGKCLLWLREQHAALQADDRAALNELLAGTGCEALFS
jgi:glutathione S-transferase